MSAQRRDGLAMYVGGGVVACVLGVVGVIVIAEAATSGDQSSRVEDLRARDWSGIETISQTRRDLEATYPTGPERDWYCRTVIFRSPSVRRGAAVDLSDFLEARDGVEFVDSTTVEGAMLHWCVGVKAVRNP